MKQMKLYLLFSFIIGNKSQSTKIQSKKVKPDFVLHVKKSDRIVDKVYTELTKKDFFQRLEADYIKTTGVNEPEYIIKDNLSFIESLLKNPKETKDKTQKIFFSLLTTISLFFAKNNQNIKYFACMPIDDIKTLIQNAILINNNDGNTKHYKEEIEYILMRINIINNKINLKITNDDVTSIDKKTDFKGNIFNIKGDDIKIAYSDYINYTNIFNKDFFNIFLNDTLVRDNFNIIGLLQKLSNGLNNQKIKNYCGNNNSICDFLIKILNSHKYTAQEVKPFLKDGVSEKILAFIVKYIEIYRSIYTNHSEKEMLKTFITNLSDNKEEQAKMLANFVEISHMLIDKKDIFHMETINNDDFMIKTLVNWAETGYELYENQNTNIEDKDSNLILSDDTYSNKINKNIGTFIEEKQYTSNRDLPETDNINNITSEKILKHVIENSQNKNEDLKEDLKEEIIELKEEIIELKKEDKINEKIINVQKEKIEDIKEELELEKKDDKIYEKVIDTQKDKIKDLKEENKDLKVENKVLEKKLELEKKDDLITEVIIDAQEDKIKNLEKKLELEKKDDLITKVIIDAQENKIDSQEKIIDAQEDKIENLEEKLIKEEIQIEEDKKEIKEDKKEITEIEEELIKTKKELKEMEKEKEKFQEKFKNKNTKKEEIDENYIKFMGLVKRKLKLEEEAKSKKKEIILGEKEINLQNKELELENKEAKLENKEVKLENKELELEEKLKSIPQNENHKVDIHVNSTATPSKFDINVNKGSTPENTEVKDNKVKNTSSDTNRKNTNIKAISAVSATAALGAIAHNRVNNEEVTDVTDVTAAA